MVNLLIVLWLLVSAFSGGFILGYVTGCDDKWR